MINERTVVLDVLLDIEKNKAYSNLALKEHLGKIDNSRKREKSFINEIVIGVIRNQAYLDYVINLYASISVDKMKPVIRNILRLSSYQIIFMDRVPISAACNEGVKLVKDRKIHNLSGFVNAVLRKVSKKDYKIEDKDPIKYLSIKYSHPVFLIKYYLESYDIDFVEKMLKANNQRANVTIVNNKLKNTKEDLEKRLKVERGVFEDNPLNEESLDVKHSSDIAALKTFKNGRFFVQDVSSSIAAKLLDCKEDEKVLDLCAAPGGKTAFMAIDMQNKGLIDAWDIYEHKIFLINSLLKRLEITNVNTKIQDSTELIEEKKESYDKVLLDAPCTGFGLIRKKPDIKWNKTFEDIISVSKLQRKLLDSAAYYLKPGGVLIYATCTISKIENQDNIEDFLKNNDFDLEEIDFLGEKHKYLELFPHIHATNGFFVAKLRKKL